MAYEIPYSEIGLRIRTLREANSYTRDAFAEKIRISAKFLYEIEVGKKGFSVEILYKISKALSVSTDYLVTGEDSSKLSGATAKCLEFFSPEQLTHVEAILKSVQEICTVAGNKVRERKDSKDKTEE
ncbi:MAG: helix-turn-helix domain-containing protein [Lachnospiraceae bacterium]|nr:helix-turn-helix domain-containing protein [Lachnospiraceae bacterium]